MDWLPIIRDIVIIGATASTAIVAILGINQWRTELKGKTEFEVARKLLAAAYNFRRKMERCRLGRVAKEEFPAWHREGIESNGRDEADAYWDVLAVRFQPVNDAMIELESAAFEAEALWGTEIREKTNKLKNLVKGLPTQFITNVFTTNRFLRENNFTQANSMADIRAKAENQPESSEDELSQEVNEAIAAIEDILRPHLARR